MLEDYFKNFKFKPLNDYVNKLEKDIVNVNLDSRYSEEGFIFLKGNLKSNFDLDILITRHDNIGSDIIFYFLKDGNRFEMVEFCLYDFKLPACKERHTPDGTNRSIIHDYRMEDGDNLTIYSSVFDYKDNDYLLGLESVRKVSYHEFHKKLSDEVLNNMFVPLRQIDLNNIPTIFKHDEDILNEPTINNFSIDGISYESNYLKRLNELINDNEEIQDSKEHYKSLKKIIKSNRE